MNYGLYGKVRPWGLGKVPFGLTKPFAKVPFGKVPLGLAKPFAKVPYGKVPWWIV